MDGAPAAKSRYIRATGSRTGSVSGRFPARARLDSVPRRPLPICRTTAGSIALPRHSPAPMDLSLVAQPFEHKNVLFDGLYTTLERLVAIEDYDVREDDIIICTYPKAGTHWVADIANKIMHDGDVEGAQAAKNDAAYLEMSLAPSVLAAVEGQEGALSFPSLEDLSKMPSPRILLTHLPCNLLPSKVLLSPVKVIYVYRDPRDMAVSLWHHMKPIGDPVRGGDLSWQTLFDCYLNGKVAYGSWSDHFKSCQDLKRQKPILVLQYEQMLKNLEGTVRTMAAFLGKSLGDEAIKAISESSTLKAAKVANPQSIFIRKGVSGNWLATFTVAQSDLFDAKLDSEIERLNLDTPYWPYSKIPVHHDLFNKLYKYQGVLFNEVPVNFNRLKTIYSYDDIRDDDVFVWTSPKAGTHWAADIALKVALGGDTEKINRGEIDCIDLEMLASPSMYPGAFKQPRTLAEASKLKLPRVMITHLLYRMLPEKVQQGKGKLIYVYRDPRDMAVSFYNMTSHAKAVDQERSWNKFLDSYMNGQMPWGAWWDHFLDCQRARDRADLLVLYYEEMKQDLVGNVRKVANFLGKALSEDVVSSIAKSCTIEESKAAKPNSPFIRTGTSGGWKRQFTVHQSDLFDKKLAELKANCGLNVPY